MNARRRLAFICLGLVVLTVLAYAPGLSSPFTLYDDSLYVTHNTPQLAKGLASQWDPTRAWSGDYVEFFPLRDTVYWGLFHAFKLDPVPFHVASLIFHLTATLLLLFLLLRLGVQERAAAFATLLFALHPVHIESVVWVAGLKDPMYLSFMLLGLLAYARYREKPSPGWYALMLLGLVASLLVKSLAVVMPVLMLGMELLVGQRARWKEIAVRLVGPVLITLEFFLMFIAIGKANRVMVPLHGGSFMSHVVLMAWAQAKYLKQALAPTSFRLIYCFEPPTGWGDPRLWWGVLAVAAMVVLAVVWRRDKLKLFFLGWYAVSLLPVSNLLPFPAIMADRYLYAASVGTCALLGILITKLQPRLFGLVVVATAVLLTSTTAARSWVWQNEENLWEEPDEDPACMVDIEFPAAQGHYMRFQSAKDRLEGFLALERVLASPGINGIGEAAICSALISAAGEAAALSQSTRAVEWAKAANRLCPTDPRGWNITMVINMHKKPKVTAMAATKAYRLAKDTQSEVLMWLARLELDDPAATAEITRLAKLGNPSVCQKVVQWSIDAPTFAPRFAEAVEVCLSAGLTNQQLPGQGIRAYGGPLEPVR